jgi:hypothetical protein
MDLTPDARSVWLTSRPGASWLSKILRVHIPSNFAEVLPLNGPGYTGLSGLCVKGAYSAAVSQPDCSANPTDSLCVPLANCGNSPSFQEPCRPFGTPTIAAVPDQTNAEGDPVGITLSATDPVGLPLTYFAGPLPHGLTFDPSTHTISGTLSYDASDALGGVPQFVWISVTNTRGLADVKSFSWTVNNLDVVLPGTPVVSNVSPTTGTAGTLVTITGSGFGRPQGSGTVWVGTRAAVVQSWNDTVILAAIASGSSTGTLQVHVSTGDSEPIPFTVVTPLISAIDPASAVPAATVTISGSGFGPEQRGGGVWLGSAALGVTQWSDTQIQATLPANARSGNVQVLQGGVMSNAVALSVAGGPPHIDGIWPTSGSAGSTVYIFGQGFGDAQGTGAVTLGGAAAAVGSWSDTFVQVTVGSMAISGVLKLQQGGLWSNPKGFVVPSTDGSQLTLSPNIVNLTVGESRSIQALDQNGGSVAGLTWTSSDTSIVTVSTDPSPVITAVSPGSATVNVGVASVDVTVYAAGECLRVPCSGRFRVRCPASRTSRSPFQCQVRTSTCSASAPTAPCRRSVRTERSPGPHHPSSLGTAMPVRISKAGSSRSTGTASSASTPQLGHRPHSTATRMPRRRTTASRPRRSIPMAP